MAGEPASLGPAATRESRHRRLLFAGLYLCEGAPIGFLWWALPTILRERGMALDRIGVLSSLLVLPWALKFLWAPALDVFGARALKPWIVGAQLAMAATLLPLAVLRPGAADGWIVGFLVLHAFFAASQDAAIDSLAIRTVPVGEQGSINGWMQLGMLVGRSLFGGGALFARSWVGDRGIVLILCAGLGASALVLSLMGHRPEARAFPTTPVRARLLAAIRKPTTWLALAFAATSGAGFEVVGALAGPMLLDHGASDRTIGFFFGVPAVVAMALGALAGGRAGDRLGTRRSTLLAGILLGASVLALSALAGATEPRTMLVLLTLVYFLIGGFTASSYALFMELTDPALGATQFSAYMGATNACESWSANVGGRLAASSGYGIAFALPALVGLLALGLLWPLRRRRSGV